MITEFEEGTLEGQIAFEESFNRPANEAEMQAIATSDILDELTVDFYREVQEASELDETAIADGMFNAISSLGDAYLSHAKVDHKGAITRPGSFTPAHTIQILRTAFNCDVLAAANILEVMNGVIFDAVEQLDQDGNHVGAMIEVEFVVLPAEISMLGKTPLPLTIEPRAYETFEEGGYYSEQSAHSLMLKNSESQWDADMTAVNHFMKTAWVIRQDLFDEVDYCDYLFDKAVADYRDPSADIATELRENASRTASMVAGRINCYEDGERVFFSWRRDSRGRYYAVGWGISPQSDGYMKGCLQPVFD